MFDRPDMGRLNLRAPSAVSELQPGHGAAVFVRLAAFLPTVFTDHHLAVIRVLPYKLHLTVDLIVGITFLAAPFLFGFAGLDSAFYLLNGAAVVAVISLTAPEEADAASA